MVIKKMLRPVHKIYQLNRYQHSKAEEGF